MSNAPHKQPFSVKPRHAGPTRAERRLSSRRHDYHAMIAQKHIGDGHRGVDGYRCPGSNKK